MLPSVTCQVLDSRQNDAQKNRYNSGFSLTRCYVENILLMGALNALSLVTVLNALRVPFYLNFILIRTCSVYVNRRGDITVDIALILGIIKLSLTWGALRI